MQLRSTKLTIAGRASPPRASGAAALPRGLPSRASTIQQAITRTAATPRLANIPLCLPGTASANRPPITGAALSPALTTGQRENGQGWLTVRRANKQLSHSEQDRSSGRPSGPVPAHAHEDRRGLLAGSQWGGRPILRPSSPIFQNGPGSAGSARRDDDRPGADGDRRAGLQ